MREVQVGLALLFFCRPLQIVSEISIQGSHTHHSLTFNKLVSVVAVFLNLITFGTSLKFFHKTTKSQEL